MQNDPDELGPKHLTDDILVENKIEANEDDLNSRIEVLRSNYFHSVIFSQLKFSVSREILIFLSQ